MRDWESGARCTAREALVDLACQIAGPALAGVGRDAGRQRPWPPSRVLLVKPCCFGDLLMATPVFAALRATFPALDLALLTSSWARPAVATNPDLSRIISSDALGLGRPDLAAALRLGRRLHGERFDWLLVLDRSPLLALLALASGAPLRAGLDSRGRGLALTCRIPVPPDRHEADLYQDVLRPLDVPVRDPLPRYVVDPRAAEQVDALLGALGAGRPLAVLHPGGGQNPGTTLLAKRWAPERYAALATRLVARAGATVLVVGAESDRPATAAVAAGLRPGARWHDLTARLALPELAALCARADLYVGNDSGPLHLAAAVGAPTLGLFGPTPPARYAPRGPRAVALRVPLDCRPCWRGGPFPQCAGRCMAALDVETVWAAAQRLLESYRAAS
ncbi:MAG: lipopolysaccharide heptosyltransferase II [Chloroflexi bacterium]|nr:lipopolysaccharide heptosyltransferase II [Chloroflexota bacterium]